MGTNFLACPATGQGVIVKLKEGPFRLDIRKKVFTMRVLKHCNTLPREGVPYPIHN